jgi:hypothetical protein
VFVNISPSYEAKGYGDSVSSKADREGDAIESEPPPTLPVQQVVVDSGVISSRWAAVQHGTASSGEIHCRGHSAWGQTAGSNPGRNIRTSN